MEYFMYLVIWRPNIAQFCTVDPKKAQIWVKNSPKMVRIFNFDQPEVLKWWLVALDNLKILIVEYLSNHWSDLAQILNFRLFDHNNVYKCKKQRRPSMEMT